MSNSKLAVEYFSNVEFDTIDDPQILQNIHDEIKVGYFNIINHNTLSYKLEELLNKSTHTQRMQFLLQTDNKICQTKLGSRIIEKIFILCESSFTSDDIENITNKYEKDFVEMFAHKNSTFVVRKMITEKFLVLANRNYENVILNLERIFFEDNALITLQQYLESIDKKQRLIKYIVKDHFNIEDLKSTRSYLFQKIVYLSNGKNLDRIFEKIQNAFVELCEDRYGNFVMKELVGKDKKNILFYYRSIKKNIEIFERNSNIILNLCINLYNVHPDRACKFVKAFYLNDGGDIYSEILIKDGLLDTKFTRLIICMLKTDKKYNLNASNLFLENFSLNWLKQQCGRELFESYLKLKTTDKRALIGLVKENMGKFSKERKMMQYLENIMKKYKQ